MIGEPPNRLGLAVQLSLADERQASAEEGAKDRACAPVSAAIKEAGRWIVVVVSITRSPPIDAAAAIEISAATNVRLGLGQDGPGLSAAKRVCSLGRANTGDRRLDALRRVSGTGRCRRSSTPSSAPNRSNSPGRAV
jgi:hypothetical protein